MRLRDTVILLAFAGCTPTAVGGPNLGPFDGATADLPGADLPELDASSGDAALSDAPAPDLPAADKPMVTPDVVSDPDVVALPDVVSDPDVVVAPDVVTQPDVVVLPDVVTQPDVVSADAGASCRGDRDCSARNQVCDVARAVCVDCVRDVDCVAPNTFCLANRCAPRIACTSSRMCPGQVCDATRMLCVDCVANNDCGPDQVCREGACVAGPSRCRSNTDCPGRVCDTGSGQCVECVAPSDCGAGRTCRANACVALTCTPNAVDCVNGTTLRRCSADGMSQTTMTCPPASNADGVCSAGACRIACRAGFADCDGNPANGCEADLTNSASHCGACNNRCAPLGDASVGACSLGRCATACPAGRGDCDGNLANGCETDLNSSASHCGACGNACGAGTSCGAGACAVMIRGLGGSTGFGPDANCLHPTDDGSYSGPPPVGTSPQPVAVPFGGAFGAGLNFYGTTYTTMFVNNNGNISFRAAQTSYNPQAFPSAANPMIAPWWADVDTRGGGQPARNNVCWFVESGRAVITWDRVGYYNAHDNLQNSFQIVLRNRADVGAGDFDVEFRYERCAWTTGDASGGLDGLGGTPAQIGFDAGDRLRSLTHPLSRTMSVLDVCRSSNVGQRGIWRYTVRGGVVASGG